MKKRIEEFRKSRKSIWVFHVNTGGCNGCDIEIVDTLTPYHDLERFGIKRVSSPRHADMLLVTGPASRQSVKTLLNAYEATPEPKLVVAIGSCACGGGIWHDSFATMGGIENCIPVDAYIPGCPPKPEALIYGILLALGEVKQKISKKEFKEERL